MILRECPITYITDQSRRLLAQFWKCHEYRHIEGYTYVVRSGYPRSGGTDDQDHFTMQAFETIKIETQAMVNKKDGC